MFASGCCMRLLGSVELRENSIDIKIGVDGLGVATCQLPDPRLDLSPYLGDFFIHAIIKALRSRAGYRG